METVLSLVSLQRRRWGALLMVGLQTAAGAATLQDFGYEAMKVNGKLSKGSQPLLLIVVTIDSPSLPALPNNANFYSDLVFNSGPGTVNGYFETVSNSRFAWSRAALINIIRPAAEGNDRFASEQLFFSNIVYQAMTSGQFNLGAYDVNRDNVVTQDELQIEIINNYAFGAAVRYAGCVTPSGSAHKWCGEVASWAPDWGLYGLCHELSHLLKTVDLYGIWSVESLNAGLTLTSIGICHLDPWHKMQLGWCEPRIRSLRASGQESVPAAQMGDPTAPVILYDPNVGTSEFFILEYRTPTSPNGVGYENDVPGAGLAVWHVQQKADHSQKLVPPFDAGLLAAQKFWRWCKKCQGLHYINSVSSPRLGRCPKDGQQHAVADSIRFQVVLNTPFPPFAPGQHGWLWCRKCEGLFFGPNEPSSRCPVSGTHDGSGSGDYSLVYNVLDSPGQHGWRWCRKCQGMFYGPGQGDSACPAGGAHDGSGSGNYAMLWQAAPVPNLNPDLDYWNYTVWNEGQGPWGPCGSKRGSSTLWGSNATTPPLRWNDGGESSTAIHVRPFSNGDGSVTIEWPAPLPAGTWVDFNYTGLFEAGTIDFPYKTLAGGLSAVPVGGTLNIKHGFSYLNLSVTNAKPIVIRCYGGPVTIVGPP
jgi:M6 family metalloprotease-like protein